MASSWIRPPNASPHPTSAHLRPPDSTPSACIRPPPPAPRVRRQWPAATSLIPETRMDLAQVCGMAGGLCLPHVVRAEGSCNMWEDDWKTASCTPSHAACLLREWRASRALLSVADTLTLTPGGGGGVAHARPTEVVDGRDSVWRSRAPGPHAHRNAARQAMDGLRTEVWGQQEQSNDPHNNQHNPRYANYWAPLTRKRHIPPHPAQPRHTNYWAPRTRKRHQQEPRPQRSTESSDPTQHAKGRTGDCPDGMSHRGGGWHDAWWYCSLQVAAPVGLSPLPLSLKPRGGGVRGYQKVCVLHIRLEFSGLFSGSHFFPEDHFSDVGRPGLARASPPPPLPPHRVTKQSPAVAPHLVCQVPFTRCRRHRRVDHAECGWHAASRQVRPLPPPHPRL